MRQKTHNVIFKDNELYVKGERIDLAADGLVIRPGGELSSYTYFGALSLGKWKKYTIIKDIGLCITVRGELSLKVWHVYKDPVTSVDRRDCIYEQNVKADDFQSICPDITIFDKGLVYFTISDVKTDSEITEAYYYTETDTVNDIRLAINICTYKRDEYLARNVEMLRCEFLDKRGDRDIEVFITDNASQIPTDRFSHRRIHLVHNKNLGGAGGFTRGLCEILRYNDRCDEHPGAAAEPGSRLTHVLFMDDDVTIEPESIRRTIMLLSYLKDEYASSYIAGAMLREEQPHIQHENGALWNAGRCKFIGRGIDLREGSALVDNEADFDRDYAAWWYCCIPMSAISYTNLPIPIFVHEDDVEYSLRNAKGLITLNGICVWHPASLHRRQSIYEYYNLRNLLIVNSRYCREYGVLRATGRVAEALGASLMLHRYKDMKIVRKAVIDYLAGPDHLMSVDQSELHRTIAEMGYRSEDVSPESDDPSVVLQAGTTLWYSIELYIRLLLGYKRTVGLYNDKWDEMTSYKYWEKAFALEDVGDI